MYEEFDYGYIKKERPKNWIDDSEGYNQKKGERDKSELNTMKKLFKYYVDLGQFYCCNNNLYKYDEENGYLRKIDIADEHLKIKESLEYEDRCNISSKQIEELIKRLKSEPSINLDFEKINSNSQYINCKNGVVDIASKKLLPHDKKYNFTYYINANYKGDIEDLHYGEETLKFFESSLQGDKFKRKLLMEIIGYLISDFNNAKKAFIFLGKPHSGKSVLTKLITILVGNENVSNIPFHKLNDRFSNSQLSECKLNINAELDSSPVRKISNFKAIVGGDIISAEYKGRPLFSFKSKTKLLFCGNAMPEIKDIETTQAFTDRLIFLMFNRSTPKEEIDYELESKLIKEIDVLFTKAIYALNNLINNNFQFSIPEDSKKFLEEYSNNQNHITEFVRECCIISQEEKIHTKSIFILYQKFCENNCITPYTQNKFSEYIASIEGIQRTRFRENGINARGFKGINIKNFNLCGTEQE